MTTAEFAELGITWTVPREVSTSRGPRLLRKGAPGQAFWAAWKRNKDALREAGISVSKQPDGSWEVCHWQPLPPEEIARRAAAVAASKAADADIAIPAPPGLAYLPFQKAGIARMLQLPNAFLCDQMGLGKTIQLLGLLNAEPSIQTVLIICPKTLKLNWHREAEKWLTRPMSIGVVDGVWPHTDMVIIHYEALKKFHGQLLERTWDLIVWDEAHLIKNKDTQRSIYSRGYARARKGQDAGKVPVPPLLGLRKIRLTGTPIVNRPVELHNLISDLHPDWADFWKFAKRYCNAQRGSFGWDFSGASNLDELQLKLRQTIMVRRLKEDVLKELPPKFRQVIAIEADDEAQVFAVRAEQHFEAQSEARLADLRARVELSKAENDEAYAAAVKALRAAEQVDFTEMSRLRHATALAKVPAVVEYLHGLMDDNDQKVVCWGHHLDVIEAIRAAGEEAGWNPVRLTGEDDDIDRQLAVDAFQEQDRCRLFVGGIMAGGVGITLTAASTVVFAELDWVPGNVTQAEDRCHRIGQHDNVTVYHLVLEGSIDARMAQVIVDKQAVIDSALDQAHPERTAPAYKPRAAAATSDVPKTQIEREAKRITPEIERAVLAGLRMLSGLDPDFAAARNDVGFNKIDGLLGHSLAGRESLTPKQAALGRKVLLKYWRQIPEEVYSVFKELPEVAHA